MCRGYKVTRGAVPGLEAGVKKEPPVQAEGEGYQCEAAWLLTGLLSVRFGPAYACEMIVATHCALVPLFFCFSFWQVTPPSDVLTPVHWVTARDIVIVCSGSQRPRGVRRLGFLLLGN